MNYVDRCEACFECTLCSLKFWRYLSPEMTCTRCHVRNKPTAECTGGDVVAATYSCPMCFNQWQATFTLAKQCTKCSNYVLPVDPMHGTGTVHAACDLCKRTSFEVNATMSSLVTCRGCSRALIPAVICSDHKRSRARSSERDIIDRVKRATYTP